MNNKFRCTFCFKDTDSYICEKCKHQTYDPWVEHPPQWSRYTIDLVECAVCGRTTTYDKQTNHLCPPKK
jgi:predicted RNA-binding Zn-ribbon protein involved in translation (DUF1610 family)